MSTQRFARDISGAPVGALHWDWGSLQKVTLTAGGASARSATALAAKFWFVRATIDIRLVAGGAAVVATAAHPAIPAGAIVYFPRAAGETHVAAIAEDGASAGVVEVWEADDFEPAL